jgi:hypothetical protein
MNWTYIKNIGLHSDNPDIKLTLGSDRQNVRTMLNYDPAKNKGRGDNEDSYKYSFPDNWFRLSFDNDKLSEIEVLGGVVTVAGVAVKIYADLKQTIKQLTDKGFSFQEGDYSFTDFVNMVDIGDSEKNGRDTSDIAWFYTGTDFSHFQD